MADQIPRSSPALADRMLGLFYLIEKCHADGVKQEHLDLMATVLGVNREQAEAAFVENVEKGYVRGRAGGGGHA